jgi:hypothetical protein
MLISKKTGSHPNAFSRVLAGLITDLGTLRGGIIMHHSHKH